MKRAIKKLTIVVLLFSIIGCGKKEPYTIDNTMPTSNKDFEEMGFTIYDAKDESLGINLGSDINIEFSSIIMNDNKSVIAFTEDYSFIMCKDPNSLDWSIIKSCNPNYLNNEYMTFQDDSKIPSIAIKNAYIIAQIMKGSTTNSMKYVLPSNLANAIPDDEVDVTISLMDSSETGEFPKDISEGMWMIMLAGKKTNNVLAIVPGKKDYTTDAYSLELGFSKKTIENNPELRDLYANYYSKMEEEESSFDSNSMKADLGNESVNAIIKLLPYLNK